MDTLTIQYLKTNNHQPLKDMIFQIIYFFLSTLKQRRTVDVEIF